MPRIETEDIVNDLIELSQSQTKRLFENEDFKLWVRNSAAELKKVVDDAYMDKTIFGNIAGETTDANPTEETTAGNIVAQDERP